MSYLLERFAEFRPYVEILNATSSMLAIVTWLVAVPFLIVAWRRSKQVKLSLFGIEATFQRGIEAAAAIGAATAQRSADGQPVELRPSAVARAIETAVAPSRGRRRGGKSILWVDDQPRNIEYERQALTALGFDVTIALDTEPALQKMSSNTYDLVISDMGRPSGARAGYTLLQALRQRGIETPFLICSSSDAPEHKQEALRRGAQGATNDPQELLELVVQILGGAQA